jgi:hypothetical protein
MNQLNHQWHVAINQFAMGKRGKDWPGFMYEAKDLASESKRLVLLFKKEREGMLGKLHRQCSLSAPVPVEDNHLTCCLGTECRKCEALLALEKAEKLTHEQIDEIKAWTCCSHILMEGGDMAGEWFILTTDDRMYWDNVYESLSYDPEQDEPDAERRKG